MRSHLILKADKASLVRMDAGTLERIRLSKFINMCNPLQPTPGSATLYAFGKWRRKERGRHLKQTIMHITIMHP